MGRRRQRSRPGFGAALEAAGAAEAWAFDAGRFGPRVWRRRRGYPRGARPPWVVEDRDAWLGLSAAVAPATGRGFFLRRPGIDKAWVPLCLDAFGREVAGRRIGLVLDGSAATGRRWPGHPT